MKSLKNIYIVGSSHIAKDSIDQVKKNIELLKPKIVALELKLSRVQDVLRQATSHLAFADESYVALPMETALRLARSGAMSPFIKNGIGIVGLHRENYKIFRSPKFNRTRTDPVLQAYCVERFWRNYPKGN